MFKKYILPFSISIILVFLTASIGSYFTTPNVASWYQYLLVSVFKKTGLCSAELVIWPGMDFILFFNGCCGIFGLAGKRK